MSIGSTANYQLITSDNEPRATLYSNRRIEADRSETHHDQIHNKMASFITNLKSAQENILVRVDDMKNSEVTLRGKQCMVKGIIASIHNMHQYRP